MKITKREENGETVLAVEGWLDTPSSAELMRAVEAAGDAKRLVLDFGGVEYVCSAGLRAVLRGYQKMRAQGGEFAVVRVRDEVMDVFRLTGLAEGLNVTTEHKGGRGL